ncbi:hypothetical protein PRIPAC_81498 [Pristionchus pacificus]|uniref:Uncharacterized protein n=1 Tax=Pristionchus pacificus TaxID=54126 RepID=A0A2A6BXH0_PRIPA|nr:hypothetical protein PRIPAC_81498 [Pristionchus pacificus]|eukprot:PDM70463.1 hypothetical protein PRIPAC_46709 [Pristionchus pacificus]
MSPCRSVVCCAHGVPCITGTFQSAFEGLHLSDLDRRHGRADANEESDAQTAFLRSMTGRSTTPTRSRSSTSTIYENQIEREPEKSQTQQQQQPQQARESLGEELRQRQRQDGGGPAVKVYIGIKTSDEAESIVTRPTDFKIYHKLSEGRDIGALRTNLSLYIVYRSTRNAARHIPIKTVVENKRRFLSAGSRSRDNKRLLFESIDALVKYYKTYVQLQPQDKTGMADVFPA